MYLINLYLFKKTSIYILQNIIILTILVLFINIIEISRIIENNQSINISTFLLLSFLKIPSIISETISFIIIIAIAFMYRNLISNNELISMRNIGFSIIDIYKPVSLSIFMFGLFILFLLNPLAANFEKKFNEITSKENTDIYSIKFIDKGMWIKNILDKDNINFINISEINLNNMKANKIKILNINNNQNKIIIAKNGIIEGNFFKLNNLTIYNTTNDQYIDLEKYNHKINFDKKNIIDSISNYKFIPYYGYYEHINNLKKFNLHSAQISLYYLSEILKPFFLIVIGLVVMGFSGKFKRNESFFKVLFISVLIGFVIFLIKELFLNLTSKYELNFIFSYIIIFALPLIIGLYQMINIEKDSK